MSRRVAVVSAASRESDGWRYVLLAAGALASMAVAVPVAHFGAAHGQRVNGTLFVVRFVMASTTVFVPWLAVAGLIVDRRRLSVSREERDISE